MKSKGIKKDNNLKINKLAYWGDDYVTFKIVLSKCGVHLSELDCPVDTKRKFRCWIEDW